jgi:hypothetical protein
MWKNTTRRTGVLKMTTTKAIEILNEAGHRQANKNHKWYKSGDFIVGPNYYDFLTEFEAKAIAKAILEQNNKTTTELNTKDYRDAPGGIGPQASEWEDKPHRLIYDLCGEIERLRSERFHV